MDDHHFTLAFSVDKTSEEVFDAINNVRGWWTENLVGSSQQLNDEFEVRFGDVHYSRQKLVEVASPKKITWLVTDSKLSFINDNKEWTNTRIEFDITSVGNKTQVRFTHVGLVPNVECYDACSNAWSDYITNSLRKLITTGEGTPTAEGETEQKTT